MKNNTWNPNFATRFVTTIGALIIAAPLEKYFMPPAHAGAQVTYRQKRVCSEVAAQPARNAGFIRVGNQVQQINVDSRDAYQDCGWVTDEAGRVVTHSVDSPYSDF